MLQKPKNLLENFLNNELKLIKLKKIIKNFIFIKNIQIYNFLDIFCLICKLVCI